MMLENLGQNRELIWQSAPTGYWKRVATGEHIHPIQDGWEGTKPVVAEEGAFTRQLIEVWREDFCGAEKSEVIIPEGIRANDYYIHQRNACWNHESVVDLRWRINPARLQKNDARSEDRVACPLRKNSPERSFSLYALFFTRPTEYNCRDLNSPPVMAIKELSRNSILCLETKNNGQWLRKL
jgi:hypothetical protein